MEVLFQRAQRESDFGVVQVAEVAAEAIPELPVAQPVRVVADCGTAS